MDEEGVVSVYMKAQYKVYKTEVNDLKVGNKLDREFDKQDRLGVIVSDLT